MRDIGDRAAQLNEKLKRYSESMLLSYDPSWPASEVGKLVSTLASNDEDGHYLFMEYLRHAMRRKAGVGRKWRALRPMAETHPNAKVSPQSDGNSLLEQRTDSQLLSDRIEMAKMRSLHLAKLGDETLSKALQAEEEKVRLEALTVVAARKQIADAEAASRAALERLEQIRLARIAEEERVSALEQQQLTQERAASQALAVRLGRAESGQTSSVHPYILGVSQQVITTSDKTMDNGIDDELSLSSSAMQEVDSQVVAHVGTIGDGAVDSENVRIRTLQHGADTALITLDFKSISKPNAENDTLVGYTSSYDPFAYEEQLSVQNQDTQMVPESSSRAEGRVAVRKGSRRKKRTAIVQSLTAALFLSLGLFGGRFLFHQSQTTTQLVKAQPISYPAETTSTRLPVSSVTSIEVQDEKGAYPEVALPISLKMSDHLSL